MGYRAGYLTTSGNYNVAMGLDALYSNTTSSNNIAIGHNALYSNTTAANNTAVGYQAGYSNTTGTANVYSGRQTGYTGTTGNYNTFVGDQAGYTFNNDRGTFVGAYAGQLSTGFANTFIGQDAGAVMTTGAKNTIIGRYGGNGGGYSYDVRTTSNFIALSDGDGNVPIYWNSAGTANMATAAGTSQLSNTYSGNYANGATVDFAAFSGMIIVNNWAQGGVGVFIVGGGGVTLIGSVSPGYGSIAFTAGVYRWTNSTGGTDPFTLTAIKTRNSA
jgi:hypothetical protein